MKIHPDWSTNGSIAITFDDDGDDASETHSDFSRFLKIFNIKSTTFKLRGSQTASMVIPISVEETTENETNQSSSEVNNDNNNDDNEDGDVENAVVKKKKKKHSSST